MTLGRITTIERLKDPQGAIILCAYCEGEGKEPLRTELIDVTLRSEYVKSLPKVIEWHPHNLCPICKGDLILKVVFEDSDSYLSTNDHCWGTGKDPSSWNQGIPRLCPKCSGLGVQAYYSHGFYLRRFSLRLLTGEEKLYKQRIGTVKNLLAQTRKLSAKSDPLKSLAQQLKLFVPNDSLLEANTDERLAYLMLYFTHGGSLNEDHEFLKHNKRALLLYYLALFEKANELNCQNIFHKAGNSICFYISSPLSYKIRKEQFPTEDSQNTSEEIELLIATGSAIRDKFYETIGWLIKAIAFHHFHFAKTQTQAAMKKGLGLVAQARYVQTVAGSTSRVSEIDELVELALPLYFQPQPI